MRIAVASGKGGVGKTTLTVNLAHVAADQGLRVQVLDCDVEEPDCALFLGPRVECTLPVEVFVPAIDESRCTHCGVCGDICEFRAIVALPGVVLTFPELCHSCGACLLLCPEGAIVEVPRSTGVVEAGWTGGVDAIAGTLNVGEARSLPMIKAVKGLADPVADLILLDAPPGTSCPMIETVRGADLVLLVTEPTPFGLHDVRLAVETVRTLGLPVAVISNRADTGDVRLREYCAREGIEILLEIPDDRRLAEACSRGQLAVDVLSEYRERFAWLLAALGARVRSAARGVLS